jgi:hypothetical protein
LIRLLNNLFDKKYITVLFCPSTSNKIYKDLKIKRLVVVNKFEPIFIKLAEYINASTENTYKFLFVFDDMIDLERSGNLKQLVLRLRNLRISTIIAVQYPTLLEKKNRGSICNEVFFGYNNYESRLKVWYEFLRDIIPDVSSFKESTDEHKFIFRNNINDEWEIHKVNDEKIKEEIKIKKESKNKKIEIKIENKS